MTAELCRSSWLRIYSGATTYARWQNYYSTAANSYDPLPFEAGGITAGEGFDQTSISVRLPATVEVIAIVEAAIAGAYLLELQTYQFAATAGQTYPPSAQTLICQFTGEVVSASDDLSEINIEAGSSLSPVGAQVPARKYTTTLVGEPCRL